MHQLWFLWMRGKNLLIKKKKKTKTAWSYFFSFHNEATLSFVKAVKITINEYYKNQRIKEVGYERYWLFMWMKIFMNSDTCFMFSKKITILILNYFYWSTIALQCYVISVQQKWISYMYTWERLRAGGEGDDRGWDGSMVSPTQWTWVWVDSGSWWWTGSPGMLRFMGSQRVGHDWLTELNWTELIHVSPLSWPSLLPTHHSQNF